MTSVTLGDLIIDEAARKTMAQDYLDRGWSVLPVHPGKKTPASRHGVKDAVSVADPSGSRNWVLPPDYWLAVATGAGVCVLDVDVKGDKRGNEAIEKLRAAGLLDGALGVVITPSGGRHFYFPAADAGVKSRANASWGLDWQCAGKYVVAPPSPGYVWESWSGEGKPLEWDAVCDVLGIKKPSTTESGRSLHVSPVACSMELAKWLSNQTTNRNGSLFWAACRLAEFDNAIDADFEVLKEASLSTSEIGEDREDEVTKTIQSARESVRSETQQD